MSESFGTRLRNAREQRGVSLADIAERTKIKLSLFEAVERDDASHWPSGIFRRSFMRAYADAVGLDGDATVREFLQRFPDPADPPPPPAPVPVADTGADVPLARQASVDTPPRTSRHAAAAAAHGLRLTLVETGLPYTGGRVLADVQRRWAAAAWDAGSLVAIALSVFVWMDAFWMPFGITALCYYIGGVLLLGNSPGVCLFAPRPAAWPDPGAKPARVPRHRPFEPAPVRPDTPFRSHRARRSDVRG